MSGRIEDKGEELFEQTLRDVFGERMKVEDNLCQEIWSSLANIHWYNINEKVEAGFSFRGAGSLIAGIRGKGSYLDWYCSGPYATITDEIRRHLRKAGWIPDELGLLCDTPGCISDAGSGYPTKAGYRWSCHLHYKPDEENK